MENTKKAIIINFLYGLNEKLIQGPFSVSHTAKLLDDYGIHVNLNNPSENKELTDLCQALLKEFNEAKKASDAKKQVYNLITKKYPLPQELIEQDIELSKELAKTISPKKTKKKVVEMSSD